MFLSQVSGEEDAEDVRAVSLNLGRLLPQGHKAELSKGFVEVKEKKLDVVPGPKTPWRSISRAKWLPFSQHLNDKYSCISLKVKRT